MDAAELENVNMQSLLSSSNFNFKVDKIAIDVQEEISFDDY